MRKKLPPLNATRAFECAARYKTFAEAAAELHVTPSAISRHVTQLEEWLGIPLFIRRQRGMELTEQGRRFSQAASVAFDGLEAAWRQLLADSSTELRFRLFPTIAFRWLVPAMIDFQKDWLSVNMQISTATDPVDLHREEVDLTVICCQEPPEGLRYSYLFRDELVPVCRPGHLPQGWPDDAGPSDLTLMASQVRPNDWATWFQGAQVERPQEVRTLDFQYSFLAYESACEGGGVVMAIKALVEDDLASGRLVLAHPTVVATGSSYFLVSLPNTQKQSIEAFHQWTEARSARSLHSPPGSHAQCVIWADQSA